MSKVGGLDERWIRNPNYLTAYDELELEFQLARLLQRGAGSGPVGLLSPQRTFGYNAGEIRGCSPTGWVGCEERE